MDLYSYLQRIHVQRSLEPTLEVLRTLHEAHLLAIPFENLSIHLGQPIVLREEALYEKIVQRHRGGFCYELNGLFAWLLRQAGFQVNLLSAGVAHKAGGFGPAFDHLALLVKQLDGSAWLADVGFGDSFLQPLRFEERLEQKDRDDRRYRLIREGGESEPITEHDGYWIMQQLDKTGWAAQYRFTLQPYALSDFTARCHYQQTSPESHFTQKRICSLATPSGRVTLSDWHLIITTRGERQERTLSNQAEYDAALADYFGITSGIFASQALR